MTQNPDNPFRGRALRKPTVETKQIGVITEDAEFQAQNMGRQRRTREPLVSDEMQGSAYMGGSIEHSGPASVIMWKPTPQGYFPRRVSVSAIGHNLANGWRRSCPDCSGQHSGDPNSCPNREPIAVRVCPVGSCRKRIYDNLVAADSTESDEADPNVIRDDAYEHSTPASRTKRQLDLHLWLRHPSWAQLHNVDSLPTALKEVVDGARAV